MPLGEYKSILVEITQEWNTAESDIKLAEQVCQNIIMPAIKELRYAGRRLADALALIADDGPKDKITYLLEEARFDCHRARHDAIDAAISKMAIHLSIAVKKLGFDVILKVYPEFAKLNTAVVNVQDQIADSRGQRADRERIYTSIENANFPDVVREYRHFICNEPIMKQNALVSRNGKRISYIVAAALIAWNVFTYVFPQEPTVSVKTVAEQLIDNSGS